ncbi:MAG: hypothetical protein R6X02_23855 [Enhygromyxa sp.]
MSSLLCRWPCAVVIVLVACNDVGQEEMPHPDLDASITASPDGNDNVVRPITKKRQTPADCALDIDFRDWLFAPSLSPIPERPISPRNSATRVHRLRERIVRVEVAHEDTHRHLFDLSDAGVKAMREVPDWPPLQLRKTSRPAGSKDWPVVLLIYIEGQELPFLGHPLDGELYFAEDDEPWHFYVYTEKGRFREIYPMPFGDEVYLALEGELGPPDPYGKRTAETKIEHDIRCGRPRAVPAEVPGPFLQVPRAVIEHAEPVCPHAAQPSLTPVEPPLINSNNSARRFQSVRRKLYRVDILEISTRRVLFSLDERDVEDLRRSPAESPFDWHANDETLSLPAWPIALLFHVRGESRPFLGWFLDDGDVYFVEGPDPWNVAVLSADDETRRHAGPIPTNGPLRALLVERFGKYDPLGHLARESQAWEDRRCGRVSRREGDPFPQYPKAIIEPESAQP